MKGYYLLSLKHSKHQSQYTWWGPNNSGYTIDINAAGIYTEEQINAKRYYYSNTSVMPVPVESIQELKRVVSIPTSIENYDLIGIKSFLQTAKEY